MKKILKIIGYTLAGLILIFIIALYHCRLTHPLCFQRANDSIYF